MSAFHKAMNVYKQQLKKGHIVEAYVGLMEYFRELKAHFGNKYPEYEASSSIYYGYMDMTYFALFSESLKRRKLKIAIVFVHDTFRFEVWLSGNNRSVQTEYWNVIKESGWDKYQMVSDPKGDDYIIQQVLIDEPDFNDLDVLTNKIEVGTMKFIKDVESFLSKH